MSEASTKPYLIRAIHEWCSDSGFTPYLSVAVDDTTQVPREYVRAGEIVLNVSIEATNRLKLGNDFVEFQARFNGQARDIMIPIANVSAIYARENGHGMSFEVAKAPGQREDAHIYEGVPIRQPERSEGAEPTAELPAESRTSVKPRSVPTGVSVTRDAAIGSGPKPAGTRKLHSVSTETAKEATREAGEDRQALEAPVVSADHDDPDKPTGGKPKLTRIK